MKNGGKHPNSPFSVGGAQVTGKANG